MKKGFFKTAHYILISLMLLVFSCVFYFSSIDLKLHDLFLATKPNLQQNADFLLIDIDEASIKSVGHFPFSRQLYGDFLLLLKEAKAKTISCNLDFSYESRDPEEDLYFSNALAAANNVYLAATFLEKLEDEVEAYPYTGCKNPVPFTRVSLDTPLQEYEGINPPLKKFENNAAGIGNTNYKKDKDGIIRKIPLVSKYGNTYFPNIAFTSLMAYLDNPDFRVDKNKITIYDLSLSGKNKNLKIPLTEDGCVLLKYPKKKNSEYNILSSKYLIDIIDIENQLVEEVNFLKKYDFFESVPEDANPYFHMKEYENIKSSMFFDNEEKNYSFDEYLSSKKAFFDSIEKFIAGNYLDIVFELSIVSEEDKNTISSRIDTFGQKYNLLLDSKKQIEERVKNTLCTIGTTADGKTEVLNNLILENMIYTKDFTDRSSWYVSFIIALILCFVFAVIESINSKGFLSLISEFFSFLFILIFIEYVVFLITSNYLGLAIPLISLILCFIVFILLKIISKVEEKLKNAELPLMKSSQEPSKEIAYMSFMHCEIRDFEKISSQITEKAKLLDFINTYVSEISKIIWENKGTVEIIKNASVLAMFGAPYAYENHGEMACKAALKIKEMDLLISEKIMKDYDLSEPIFTEIGINTNDIALYEADKESNFLEELNKTYSTRGIIISERTRNNIGGSFIYRRLDKIQIVGFSAPSRVYELLADSSLEKLIPYTNKWEEAITLFEQKQYNDALSVFNELCKKSKNDGVLDYYIQRCKDFIENPTAIDWDGVLYIASK